MEMKFASLNRFLVLGGRVLVGFLYGFPIFVESLGPEFNMALRTNKKSQVLVRQGNGDAFPLNSLLQNVVFIAFDVSEVIQRQIGI